MEPQAKTWTWTGMGTQVVVNGPHMDVAVNVSPAC